MKRNEDKAASDQQNADRKAASARRAQRRLDRMNRRGSDNEKRRERLQGTVDEQARYQSDFEAAVPDIQAAESLIGSNFHILGKSTCQILEIKNLQLFKMI